MKKSSFVLTLTFFLICIVAFILEIIYPEFDYFSFIPALAFKRPWTFVTSIFLHADFTHLFFNMFALLMFGIYLEGKISKKSYILIFLLSGIFGSLGYMITATDSTIPAIGASGSIYGIMGCLAILMPYAIVYVSGMPMPMIAAAFFWAVMELLGVFAPTGNIAHGAHLFGLFIGIFFGIYFKWKKIRINTKYTLSEF